MVFFLPTGHKCDHRSWGSNYRLFIHFLNVIVIMLNNMCIITCFTWCLLLWIFLSAINSSGHVTTYTSHVNMLLYEIVNLQFYSWQLNVTRYQLDKNSEHIFVFLLSFVVLKTGLFYCNIARMRATYSFSKYCTWRVWHQTDVDCHTWPLMTWHTLPPHIVVFHFMHVQQAWILTTRAIIFMSSWLSEHCII